jgi:Flp pilus assembly protein TadD
LFSLVGIYGRGKLCLQIGEIGMSRRQKAEILDFKDITEGKRYVLSCCIIARDEEESIERAIGSVRDLADEVIVVDTGSTDGTTDLARRSGARVVRVRWRDDFSEARNRALAEAAGSWILVLDADEELAPFARGVFRELIGEHPRSAFSMRQITYTHSSSGYGLVTADTDAHGDAENCFISDQVRLFPNDDRLRYRGRVHESIEDSLSEAGIPVTATDHIIHHYGRLAPSSRLPRKYAAYLASAGGGMRVRAKDARYVYELAALLFEAGEFAEAIAHAERGLGLEPENWEFLNIKGMANLALRNLEEAERSLQLAIERNASIPDLYNNIGVVLMEQKQPRRALRFLEQGLELCGGSPRMLANAASAYLSLGIHDRALVHITESLRGDPFLPRSHAVHAELLHRMGDHRGAKEALERIQFLPGTSLELYLRVIHLYTRMGMVDAADAVLGRSARDYPGHEGLLYLSAKICELKGEDERALSVYRSLVQRTPGNADLRNALGCVCERLGMLEEALGSFELAKGIDPDNPRIEMNIGIVKDRLGRTAEAEAHLTGAIAMGERTGAGYNALGCHYAGRGEYLEAVRCFGRAVEMEPRNVQFRANLGMACRRVDPLKRREAEAADSPVPKEPVAPSR